MTNWFIGFPKKQRGTFLDDHTCSDSCWSSCEGCDVRRYELQCLSLLLDEINTLRPSAILLLGTDVTGRVHNVSPYDLVLQRWKAVYEGRGPFFRQIDETCPIALDVLALGSPARTNVVPLLHPCQPQNHVLRALPPLRRANDPGERQERMARGRQWEISRISEALSPKCTQPEPC